MGLVPQGRRVFPTLSVARESGDRRARPSATAGARERPYDVPGLRERRPRRGRTLSGGEQQMLAIGRALITNPDA